MANAIVLLALLISCQIIENLACATSRSTPLKQAAKLEHKNIKREETKWTIPEEVWKEYLKNKTIDGAVEVPEELGVPEAWEVAGLGHSGQDPPPWAVVPNAHGKPDYCFDNLNVGDCSAEFPRWRYDPYTNVCVQFIFTGCGGNFNNFGNIYQCQESCVDAPQTNCIKTKDYKEYDAKDLTYIKPPANYVKGG